MVRIYEKSEDDTNYFAIIYINPQGNKYITWNMYCDLDSLKKYWDEKETPQNYKYVEIVPIQNKQAFLYFRYWNTQSKWKCNDKNFDLFKYVFVCDFDVTSYFFNNKF